MAPHDVVTAEPMRWRTVELSDRCGNVNCSNQPGEGRFVLLIEEHLHQAEPVDPAGAAPPTSPRHVVPMVLYVCAPCAAVLRGEQR